MHIPYPRPAEWNFVLVPLLEIAEDLVPAILKTSIIDLLKCSPDRHAVVKG
jgi:7,8-dihydro-6-hydroxymethylpterin-pyrophosphokinase